MPGLWSQASHNCMLTLQLDLLLSHPAGLVLVEGVGLVAHPHPEVGGVVVDAALDPLDGDGDPPHLVWVPGLALALLPPPLPLLSQS